MKAIKSTEYNLVVYEILGLIFGTKKRQKDKREASLMAHVCNSSS